MTIAIVSNFMNHHQKPLADRLYEKLGDGFLWVATTPTDEDRIRLGYDDLNASLPYVACVYADRASWDRAYRFCISCDCLIVSYEFADVVAVRMRQNKMTVYCSERVCKKGDWEMLSPYAYLSALKRFTRYRGKNFHLLSIGEHAARDFRLAGSFGKKCYRWGYFIDVPELDETGNEKWDRDVPEVFWAARMIDWKHPEYVPYAAKRLKEENIPFRLEMAGDGELMEQTRSRIRAEGLEDCVRLLGPLNHETVREKMLQANIFCLTSNRREGWGAVISEALASRCVVIASEACGAASSLIRDGENGILFQNDSPESFYQKLRSALLRRGEAALMADQGYETMRSLWNPDSAAERLLRWTKCLLRGENTPFDQGPCSQIP